MKTRESLVEKVRKLLALSTSSNEHEADLAAQHASDLMKKHQITETEAALSDAKDGNVITEYYDVPNLRVKYLWVVRLASSVASLFDAKALHVSGNYGVKIIWVGYRDDIDMSIIAFEHLFRSWKVAYGRDLAKEKVEWNDIGASMQPGDTMKFKRGHGQGYAQSLGTRIDKIVASRRVDVTQSSKTGCELVVVKEQAVAHHYSLIRTGSGSRETWGDTRGRSAGARAGNSVMIGGSLGGASKKIGASQ